MLFLPISFVTAFLIVLFLVRLRSDLRSTGPLLPALLTLLTCLAVLHGLRWGYGVTRLMPLQIALALAVPPLAYLALVRLGETLPGRDLVHAVPPLAALLAGSVWPAINDVTIPAIALAYSVAVGRLALRGSDGLPGTRLSEGRLAENAVWVCAGSLAVSGLIDAAVAIDFAVGGQRVGLLVTAAQAAGVFAAALAVAAAGRTAPRAEDAIVEPALAIPTEDEQALVARLRELVLAHELHKQPDLTLNRLARRARVPARHVSQAVNRVRGESVSRFLNRLRVEEACALLAAGDDPVTEVMLASGFQTKSNFNRAFKEVTGMGPAEWRQKASPARTMAIPPSTPAASTGSLSRPPRRPAP
jgi:AraC-like DNA-binding protein